VSGSPIWLREQEPDARKISIFQTTMFFECRLSVPRLDFYDITAKVREAIAKSGVADGIDPPRERKFFVKVVEQG
jgi:hypothetical protein